MSGSKKVSFSFDFSDEKRPETFEKCSILFKTKKGENFNPPKFGSGLKFESDGGIGQKGAFCKGLTG